VAQARAVDNGHEDIQEAINDKIAAVSAAISAKIAAITEEVHKQVADDLGDAVSKAQDDLGGVLGGVAGTSFADPKAVVFRWNEWNTYNNCCMGWFDGNNPRGFGGKHPSEWGDSNALAHQMHESMQYMKRLFSKKGKGDNFGANVCSYSWFMPHSTDDHRCGALFRIKNTGTSEKMWNMQWWWTGWHGWGNYASVAINKNNHWHGECYGYCRREENIKMAANSGGDRINTVIFISGGSGPYGHYNHYRANLLNFHKLDLPDGLEFVDDLETVGGNWR
jgi:hypothetical protein